MALNEMGEEVEWKPPTLTEPAHTLGPALAPKTSARPLEEGNGLARAHFLEAGTNISETSPKVATALGLSSLSLRLPLPSPGSASPRRESMTGNKGGGLCFDSPGLTPINANTSRSHGVNRALEFGASTGFNNDTGSNLLDEFFAENMSVSEPNGRGGRRVSFGPSARLSFSSIRGALDDVEDEPHKQPTKLQRTLLGASSSADYKSKLRSFATSRGSLPPRSRHPSVGNDAETEESSEGTLELSQLVLVLAEAHRLLHQSRSLDGIRLLHMLPVNHFSSAYVQHLLGLSYFAIRCTRNTLSSFTNVFSDYKACMLRLREMLRLEPYRVKGLEILSTALWHLRKEKDLAALAQQCVAVDKFSAEVWCVVGNCFSLQREHTTAVKFFERATQIDPHFAYAHTLCGHEHFSNESYDKAVSCFREAITLDERHVNAWYGLGAVFFRQERYDLAEYHFRRAYALNTGSSVLACYLGMVLHHSADENKRQEAHELLQKACERDSRNPQLHFQLAHLYFSTEELEKALEQLTIVSELAPKEPSVYSMLGQVSIKLGDKKAAALHFNTAMSLDPKEATAMKAAFEACLGASEC